MLLIKIAEICVYGLGIDFFIACFITVFLGRGGWDTDYLSGKILLILFFLFTLIAFSCLALMVILGLTA